MTETDEKSSKNSNLKSEKEGTQLAIEFFANENFSEKNIRIRKTVKLNKKESFVCDQSTIMVYASA